MAVWTDGQMAGSTGNCLAAKMVAMWAVLSVSCLAALKAGAMAEYWGWKSAADWVVSMAENSGALRAVESVVYWVAQRVAAKAVRWAAYSGDQLAAMMAAARVSSMERPLAVR